MTDGPFIRSIVNVFELSAAELLDVLVFLGATFTSKPDGGFTCRLPPGHSAPEIGPAMAQHRDRLRQLVVERRLCDRPKPALKVVSPIPEAPRIPQQNQGLF
jgi:hypothetical protein